MNNIIGEDGKEKLLVLMKKHGITQEEVAKYLGYSRVAFSVRINGHSDSNIEKVLKHVNPDTLIKDLLYEKTIASIKRLEAIMPDWLDVYIYSK